MRLSHTKQYCLRYMILATIIAVCTISIFIYLVYTEKARNSSSDISIALLLQAENFTDGNCTPVCVSKSCIKQADMLLRSIKPSIDPCDNFQKFLCGSYEDKFGKDEGNDILTDMSNMMLNKLKNIIENIEAESGSAAEKLKIVYHSCVNIGSSELRGIEDFRKVLNSVEISNWPYLAHDFKFSDSGLLILLATFKSYLEIKFLGFVVKDFRRNEVMLMEKRVKIYFKEDKFKHIPVIPKNEVADILEYFNMESKDIDVLFNDLEMVRNALLNFSIDGEAYLNECNENCLDIQVDCSNPRENEWIYICEMVKVYLNATNLQQYVKSENITVEKYYVYYVKNLIPRLKSLSDRSIANFFAFHLLWNKLSELNFFFRRKRQKYYKYFGTIEYQTSIVTDKWKHCLAWIINGNMKLILENELMKNYLTRTYIDEIHEIHQWHTSTINKMIDGQNWIFPDARKFLLKNDIKRLKCNMDFNQRHLPNDTYVNELYKAFSPTPKSFFLNVLKHQRNLLVSAVTLKITRPIELESKFKGSASTNNEDEIVLHYNFLMPPVYYPGHEKFINRIQLAHIVSHEIAHTIYFGLDQTLVGFRRVGYPFLMKKRCLEDQFSNFKFTFLKENLYGPRYVEENFSDNIGYAVTDKMIEELESSEEIFLLPGLPYSLKQLLYMSSRQAWCSKSSRKIDMYIKEIYHAPSEFRIIASGQNSKGYSETFSCPEGSYMNPAKKCTMFDSV